MVGDQLVDQRVERLGEGDDVERDADRLGHEQRDADGGTDHDAEGAGDDVVLATTFDLLVGRDLRQRHGRRDGDEVSDEDDRHGTHEADVPHGVAEPQEHDGAENRGDGGHEDRRGAEVASAPDQAAAHALPPSLKTRASVAGCHQGVASAPLP